MADAIHALLDDRHATAEQPTSRLYTGFVREHRCVDPAGLETMWAAVDEGLRAGLFAVLLGDYEWGAKLLHAGDTRLAVDDAASLRVLMFERLDRLSRDEADAWLIGQDEGAEVPSVAGVMNLEASVDRAQFTGAIGRIHEAIRAGETYQVNYTYRLHAEAFGSPIALYRRLRARQPVAYGAFIALPPSPAGASHVLSCSPELFLRHDSGRLTARPMKGTASRFRAPEGDSETARMLSQDIKNRAENLMIVDLLRNDIGRIARIGSVRVPALFSIEPYSTVFQMTSTVQADLLPSVDFPTLLRAVFPCGSITGAPKHHTMALIAELESTPRGLYTGAIGWIDAPAEGALCGDFCFSVAIRTLTLAAPAEGRRAARLGIGAGIVLDSRADDEYDECRLKARFLTGLDPGFELFETMLALPAQGVARLDAHLARLGHSAALLGFAFDEAALRQALGGVVVMQPSRVRLALTHDGRWSVKSAVLAALPEGPAGLLIAGHRLAADDPLAGHKTTRRGHYDAGVRAAEAAGGFDSLFFDTRGRLVEGGRSNVFLRLGGRWFTPLLADGALPGVMRAALLADPAWAASERSLGLQDLQQAEEIVVCNALRGALPARLMA